MAQGDILVEGDTGREAAFVEVPTAAGGIAKAPLVISRQGDGSTGGAASASAPAGTQSVGEPLWTSSDLTALRINTAASGVTELVSATTAQTTRVHALRLSVAGAVIVQIRDGTTVLEVFNFAGNGGGIVLDFRDRPYYKTTAATALNINLSGAVQVDGRIEYVKSA